MADQIQQTCVCGKPSLKSHGYCKTCAEQRLERLSRHCSTPYERPSTPPPEDLGSTTRRARQTRASPATAALHNSFATDDDTLKPFPRSLYRVPTRSLSRTTAADHVPRSIHSLASADSSTRQSLDETRRDLTPRDRAYSPIADVFARLSVKDEVLEGGRSRSSSAQMERGIPARALS